VSDHQHVVEWRPTASDTVVWSVVGLVLSVLGLPLFALPSILRASSAGLSIRIGLMEILVVVILTAGLLVAHEGIHGLVMLLFGARPRFGATLVGGSMPALYATSEGHRFTRGKYLIVAACPAVVISVLGFWACFGPWAGYLVLPLAIHLGGCVGDVFAFRRVVREPYGTECEDLRDGIRFYRPTVSI
jgi:putative zincin peptidase